MKQNSPGPQAWELSVSEWEALPMHPSLDVNIWGKNLHTWDWRRCMAPYGHHRHSCIQGTLENESFAGQLQKLLLLKPPAQKRWANLGMNWDSNICFVYIQCIFLCIVEILNAFNPSEGVSFTVLERCGLAPAPAPASALAQWCPSLWFLASLQQHNMSLWSPERSLSEGCSARTHGDYKSCCVQAGLQTLRWASMSDMNIS